MNKEKLGGKLELLFAHLSINNVQYIKPLLLEAIDEYQSIRSNLAYDQKRSINFIKTLLYHAEREEWNLAREQLNGAQRAYQEYVETKIRPEKQSKGYADIHGKQLISSYPNQPFALSWEQTNRADSYMFKDESLVAREEIERESVLSRMLQRNSPVPLRSTSSNIRASSASSVDEQGPSIYLYKNTEPKGIRDVGYPGEYTKNKIVQYPMQREELTFSDNNSRTLSHPNNQLDGKLDENRPLLVVEAFKELFENDWHHAISAIKRFAVPAETAINCLLYIVQAAYNLCLDESQSQLLEFEAAALNIITNGKYTKHHQSVVTKRGDLQHIVQYRKEISDLAVKRLEDKFLVKVLPIIHRQFGVKTDFAIDAYSRKCVDVTWKMAIQEPPMHIVFIPDTVNTEFSDRLYKPYKKSGRFIQYTVWPPLELYKNGPLLSRGIAEGDGHSLL